MVLIEGSTLDGVRDAGEKFLSNALLTKLGSRPEVTRGLYQLEYSLQNLATITQQDRFALDCG